MAGKPTPRKRARLTPKKGPVPDWQIKMQAVECQNIYAMENEIWTDCCFLVGKPEDKVEEIRCHKYQLAKSSPTFAAVLFGEEALKDPTQIFELDSITPAVFKAFLRYAYTGKVKYSGVYAESWELFNFAKKFRLPDEMLDQCRGHLWAYMSDGWNAWTALQYLSICDDEPRLQVIAELKMKTTLNWRNAKLMNDFLSLPQEAIIFLLESDELNVEEAALINLCCKWAKHKATGGRTEGPENTPVTPDPQAYRAALGPLLHYLRIFAVDDWKNILDEPQLPEDVIGVINRYKNNKDEFFRDDFDLCEIFSPKKTKRRLVGRNVYVYGVRPDDEDIFTNMTTMSKVYQLYFLPKRLLIESKSDDEIRVKFATQVRPVEERSQNYEEDMTIVLMSPNYEMVLFKSRFTALVNYDTILSVPMKLSARLNNKAYCGENHVIAVPHKSGVYPPGRFAISAQSSNSKKMEQILQRGDLPGDLFDVYKWEVDMLEKKLKDRADKA